MVQIGQRVTQGLRKVLRFAAVSCHDVAVLYRRYCTGNGSWTSWNRQRDPVRPAEQHQFEVKTIPHSIYTFFPFFCVFSDVITVYIFLFLFLSLEVGNCIAVQVCMLQIPLLILFNAVYVSNRKKDRLIDLCTTRTLAFFRQDVGFVLIFSDLHLWASIFSVILVNYIFMDGKCDYFQGKCCLL